MKADRKKSRWKFFGSSTEARSTESGESGHPNTETFRECRYHLLVQKSDNCMEYTDKTIDISVQLTRDFGLCQRCC